MNHRYYKFLFLFFMLISSQGILYAQNQGGMKIGNNPMLINPAAILEIETTNKGILLPRIQDTAIINVFNPPDGLMVYVIDAQNKQQLYIRHAKAWAEIQTSDNITGNVTTILNNAFGKKSISSVDGTITVIGGDTAVFRNVVLLVNKSKVVTDSAVANVMVSSLVLDSLAKAVGAKPLSDSIISLIDKHLLANAHSIASDNNVIKVSGGDGAVLQNVTIGLDNSQVGHLLTSSPVKDSLAVALIQSPVKDTLENIVGRNVPDATAFLKGKIKLNGDLSGTADLPKITSGAVTTNKLADSSVTVAKLVTAGIADANKIYATDAAGTPVLINAALMSKDTFTNNFIVKGVSNYLKWKDGQTVPAKGKTAVQLLLEGSQIAVAPSYVQPVAGISASPAPNNYEIGTNLGTVTLSSTFTQNDAGALTATNYLKNGSALSGNTDALGLLTNAVTYSTAKSYAQGACKDNNLGLEDCTGYIAAGTVTSSAIAYTPFYNRYYGFVSSRTPSDAEVQALTQDHTNAKTLTVTLTNPDVSTPMYICYRYSSLLGALTSVTVNGFPSTASFDYTVTGPFVNAQSYSSNYYLVIGKNKVDNSGLPTTTIVFQ